MYSAGLLDGQKILVTGGGTGLGRMMAINISRRRQRTA